MPALPLSDRRVNPWIARYAAAVASAYALGGLIALWVLTPRVPYADEWRHYARLLTQPFFAAVFATDNGHAEVLPNVIRWADLRWCGGHEVLQIASAALLAVIGAMLLWRLVRRDASLSAPARAAAAVCCAIGIFWLGNAHALTVVVDAAHVYWVLLGLLLALRCAAAERPNALAIGACCALATFSFGSGLATFPALTLALLLRREPRAAAQLTAITLVAGFIYWHLPGAVHEPMAPVASRAVQQTTQILGAPFVYFFWALLDPAAAAAVPEPLRGGAIAMAHAWSAHFGDIRTSVWPQAALGALFLVGVVLSSLRAARRPAGGTIEIPGLALAWFGIGCALLIALARGAYFDAYPDQIYALRYLPWTNLAWCGWLLALLARARTPRLALATILALPLLALPSELGLAKLARHVREVAEDTALDAAAGVLPADQPLGETALDDLRRALPALRAAHTAMFAWPQTSALGHPVPSDAVTVSAEHLSVDRIANALSDGAGMRLHAHIANEVCDTRLLLVRQGTVVGLMRRRDSGEWQGVASGDAAGGLTLYADCAR